MKVALQSLDYAFPRAWTRDTHCASAHTNSQQRDPSLRQYLKYTMTDGKITT